MEFQMKEDYDKESIIEALLSDDIVDKFDKKSQFIVLYFDQ